MTFIFFFFKILEKELLVKKLKSYSYNDAVVQKKVLNFLSKKKYTVTNQEEYMDNSFNKEVTNGEPLPQIKNIGILGTIFLRDIKSIQRKRSFKKLYKQVSRILELKYAPITIDVDGYIINGHHRYDAMKIFKFKTVLVRLLNLKATQILNSGEQYKDLLENMKFDSIDFSKSKVPSFQPLLGMKHKNRKDTVEIILNQA